MHELNGAETLMSFLGWLTSRAEPVTFSAHHDATLAVELFERFNAVNDIGSLGRDWPDCYTQPEPSTITNEAHESFKTQLARLINRHSLEGGSDTPDFLLADYLVQCLAVFDATFAMREAWYGRPLHGGPATVS
jgi:hypothetical protein